MKLQSVHVTNFRSVEDSEKFDVGQTTCLVGKNESGKSALLLALAALNPHESTPIRLEKERDYPRRFLPHYEERHSDKEAVVISTTWKFENTELEDIEYWTGIKHWNTRPITISKRYDQETIEVSPTFTFKLDVNRLYSKFRLSASERSQLKQVNSIEELIANLSNLNSPTQKHTELLEFLSNRESFPSTFVEFVRDRLPKFMYISSYNRMDGAVSIDQLSVLTDRGSITDEEHQDAKLFCDFLNYAGVPIHEVRDISTYETFNARLEAASNAITDQIHEYWTQNSDIRVEVRVEPGRPSDPPDLRSGLIARIRIYNQLHRVNTSFSQGSAGFVWFFSFLTKFTQVKNERSPVVLLLDEPGLSLHGKAQADLLRFIKEKLAHDHQIIYTTHSPFMIPTDNFSSVRIVQDETIKKGNRRQPIGTKVRDDVLARDSDSMLPLQGALGYEITQSLFIGENTLLVEGPSDVLYIQALSNALQNVGRDGLDPRWVVCPSGGIGKIKPFASLFASNNLNIAVLSDQGKGDKKNIEQIKRLELLKADQIYTVADLLDRPEADIEDIFDPELFVTILNSCYRLRDSNEITVEKLLDAKKSTERIVKKAEAFFLKHGSIPKFNHFHPSDWLIRNPQVLKKDTQSITSTLDRAQIIFNAYNPLLRKNNSQRR